MYACVRLLGWLAFFIDKWLEFKLKTKPKIYITDFVFLLLAVVYFLRIEATIKNTIYIKSESVNLIFPILRIKYVLAHCTGL